MIMRSIAAAGIAALFLFSPSAFAITAKEKQETCKFGADDQKLAGAKRKTFLAKCMANADAPAKKPAKPKPQ